LRPGLNASNRILGHGEQPQEDTFSNSSVLGDGLVVDHPALHGAETGKSFGAPELWILRQIPLSYERKSRGYSTPKQLGSIQAPQTQFVGGNNVRSNSFAKPTDEEEKALVAELVGDKGKINLDWPKMLVENTFDVDEYQKVEEPGYEDDAEKKTVTVLDCIEKYCQMEQLEESEQWYCSKCKKHVCAWKQFHIYRSPPHLIVHLKRFQFSATSHRRQKIGVFIDFPLEGLDLTDHVSHWIEGQEPIYDCYAVSNHYGGLGGGHYTAYAMNDGGVWCHYDDSRITENVDPKEVVSEAAYCLYYRRRDVPVGQEFEINLQTPPMQSPMIIQDEPAEKNEVSDTNPAVVFRGASIVDDEPETAEMDIEITEDGASTSPGSVDAADGSYYRDEDDCFDLYQDDDDCNFGGATSDSLPLQ
jgi:hypothetical protein